MAYGCESCNQDVNETCKYFLKSDCITVTQELQYSGVEPDTILTDALVRLDEYINELKANLINSVSILNIGNGEGIYAGDSNLGEKELKSLTSSDGSITITSSGEEIDFALALEIPEVVSATETQEGISFIATQAEVDAGLNDTKFVTPLKLAQFVSDEKDEYTFAINVDGELEVTKNGVVVQELPLPTGENKYLTDVNLDGTSLVFTMSDTTEISEDLAAILEFNQVQSDYTEENTSSAAYIKNRNANKTVFSNYTVTPSDNTYVIVADTTSNDITITVPNTLPDKFTVGVLQKGTGLVTIANADVVPVGLVNTLRGVGHHAYVEKIDGTKFLLGNLNEA